MIKNNTAVYSKKDVIYVMTKSFYRNWRNILFGAAEIILGLITLIEISPWLRALYIYGHNIFSAKDMCFLIFFSGAGLFFIAFPFFYPYLLSMKVYRKEATRKRKSLEIEFGEESIIARFANEGVCGENRYEYSAVDGYVERNHAVYIRLMIEKSKSYLILHDDAYSEGNKEELIRFLEEKSIRNLNIK